MTKWCQRKGRPIGSRGIVSRVPYGDITLMPANPKLWGDSLVFSDVPLLLARIIFIESVDGAFCLGDGLLTFRLGCIVTRFDGLLLLFAPFPEIGY